jgi:hypothetical protein
MQPCIRKTEQYFSKLIGRVKRYQGTAYGKNIPFLYCRCGARHGIDVPTRDNYRIQ